MRSTIVHLAIVGIALVAAGATLAQAPMTPTKIGSITIQGSFRSRLEAWDWFGGDANNSYAYSGNILRLALSGQRGSFDWQVEMAAPVLLGLPDDAVGPGSQGQLGLGGSYWAANDRVRNAASVFPKQAFARWKFKGQLLRLGRFEFSDGMETAPKDPTLLFLKRERISQRLIGPFGWAHVGRSFDGAHYVWNRGRTNLTLVGALPTRGAFQVDGWGNLNVAVGYAAVTRQAQRKSVSGEYRVFGIYYHDWRSVVKTDSRPLAQRQRDFANTRVGSFGGHAINSIQTGAGTFEAMLWGVLQTGKWGALDHSARAYAVEGGWQPKWCKAVRPWLRAGWSHASGDDNPLDGSHGTFFQILPTPRPYARFPFFNMMNNEDAFAMVVLRPHRILTIRPEAHSLRLAERNDLWYAGGGAFQPWTFGYAGRPSNGHKGLATLYDVSVDVAATSSISINGYFGYASRNSVIRGIYPSGKGGTLGYLELIYRF